MIEYDDFMIEYVSIWFNVNHGQVGWMLDHRKLMNYVDELLSYACDMMIWDEFLILEWVIGWSSWILMSSWWVLYGFFMSSLWFLDEFFMYLDEFN